MKEKIIFLIIGALIGAIITAGCFLIFKKNDQGFNNQQFDFRGQKGDFMQGQMPPDFKNGEMPDGDFDMPTDMQLPDNMEKPENENGEKNKNQKQEMKQQKTTKNEETI